MLKRPAVLLPGFDTVDDKARFIEIVKRAIEGDRFAVGAVGPQFLTQTPAVVFNQGVSGAQDIAGRAVVLLEADGLRAGEIGEKALNILNLGAAPAVDRLVIIPTIITLPLSPASRRIHAY